MKKIFTSVLLTSCICFAGIAQSPVDQAVSTATNAASQVPGIGTALTNIGNGLKSSSLLSSFKMPTWLSSVSKLSPSNVSGASSLLSQLGSGLNPASLMQGFSVTDWASKLKSATTISSVATQAESLLQNIKPDAFKSSFDVSKVTSMLDMLKK